MKLCPTCGEQYADAAEQCPRDQTTLIFVKDNAAERELAMLGRVIDKRYVIESRLGAGGMGTVYVAQQVAVGRRVALKVLPAAIADDMGAVKRFMQEAKAASTLSHPNTITIHDFGQNEDGLLFLVMELVEGETLAQVMKTQRVLPAERAARFASQILSALEDAHARGIVHRDLKPDNVIISPRPGNPDFAKVLDFGLAKVADDGSNEGLTKTGQVFGTPAYMSPEQARGQRCDLRTDLYAVGVMLYEMLAGRRPFDGESPISILVKHINDAPPALTTPADGPAVPVALQEVVFRALAKDRSARYESAGAMREAIETALGGAPDSLSGSFSSNPRVTAAPGSRPAGASRRPGDGSSDETLAPDSIPAGSGPSLRGTSGFLGHPGVSSPPQSLPPGAPAPAVSGRAGPIVAVVIAVVGLGGAGAWYVLQSETGPPAVAAAQPAPIAPPVATAPPTQAVPRTALVRVEATPSSTQAAISVTLQGQTQPARVLGTLPGSLDVPLGAQLKVVFSAPGHTSVERTLTVDAPTTVSIGLAPAPLPSAAPVVAQSPPRPVPPGPVSKSPAPRTAPSPNPSPAAPPPTAPPGALDDLK